MRHGLRVPLMICLTICLLGLIGTAMTLAVVHDPTMVGVKDYDPLQHSHLVVRGIVEHVTFETKSGVDWGFGTGNTPLTTAIVQIRVGQVLRGKWKESLLEGYAFWSARKFAPNEEFIFCVKWHDTTSGRVAWIGELPGLYENKGNHWVVQERFPAMGDTPESLTLDQIARRVHQASLESVADSSDVVVRGVIDSVWTSKYGAKGGRSGVLDHRRLRVTAWLKGRPQGDHLEFVIPVVGPSYVPKWYRAVPSGLSRGTEWLVFLRKGVRGYYPFGGPNSLLQVRNNNLIYDGLASYPVSLSEVTRVVKSEANHVDR